MAVHLLQLSRFYANLYSCLKTSNLKVDKLRHPYPLIMPQMRFIENVNPRLASSKVYVLFPLLISNCHLDQLISTKMEVCIQSFFFQSPDIFIVLKKNNLLYYLFSFNILAGLFQFKMNDC